MAVRTECYFDFKEKQQSDGRVLTLIIYDISDNRQRSRMVKYLEGFGFRVQKSAFEAWLDRPEFTRLCRGLDKIVCPDDHVKLYRVNGSGAVLSWGDMPSFTPEDVVII